MSHTKKWLPEGICLAVLCVILTLGLWPFHVPKNDVSWLTGSNGLRFGGFSSAFSAGPLDLTSARSEASVSLEIWLQPARIWDFYTFLALYVPRSSTCVSLRQWQTSLWLRTGTQDLQVQNVFRKTGPTFLTITAGRQGTVVYVDGVVARRARQILLSARDLDGRLVLGDSPGQGDSWPGRLLGLAIYQRELTAAQVLGHFETWTHEGRPRIAPDEGNVALYLFDERGGTVVHNKARLGADLYIPAAYTVLDQIFLESPWREYRRSRDFAGAVLKNVVGFIPFGGCFYAYFSLVRRCKRAVLTAVLLGTAVSLTIEVLQVFLPNRDSGMMDLFTNTLGTYIGVLSFKVARPFLAALWPPIETLRR